LEQWESAEADMRRSAEEDFNRPVRFEMYKTRGDWWAAAIYGERMLDVDPRGQSWIDLAPILVLLGNEDDYSDFCKRRIEADAQWEDRSGVTCKICLLLPDAVPLDQLPISRFIKLMDEGEMPASLNAWNWGARALIAYRSGAYEEVAEYVKKQQENDPNDLARALGLACLALAEHDLGKLESYETTMRELSELLDSYPQKTQRDWLIADILRREAETLE
jgi:tetratricopeptide (TPR) repeat protein